MLELILISREQTVTGVAQMGLPNYRITELPNGRMGEWANGRMGEWANGR